MTTQSWIKPAFWGLVVGAVGWWAALAYGFGWMSPSAANEMAAKQTQTAVVAAAAPYCVSRFEKAADAVKTWQDLKKSASTFDQNDFMRKGGWVSLPGQKYDDMTADAIAKSCADNLLALKEIDGVKLTAAN